MHFASKRGARQVEGAGRASSGGIRANRGKGQRHLGDVGSKRNKSEGNGSGPPTFSCSLNAPKSRPAPASCRSQPAPALMGATKRSRNSLTPGGPLVGRDRRSAEGFGESGRVGGGPLPTHNRSTHASEPPLNKDDDGEVLGEHLEIDTYKFGGPKYLKLKALVFSFRWWRNKIVFVSLHFEMNEFTFSQMNLGRKMVLFPQKPFRDKLCVPPSPPPIPLEL